MEVVMLEEGVVEALVAADEVYTAEEEVEEEVSGPKQTSS